MERETLDHILNKLKQGDSQSFEKIFKQYYRKIFTFSYSYFKNKEEAEGCVQEAFLALWKNRSKLRSDTSFEAYLFTVSFNVIKKRARQLSREKKHLQAYSLSADALAQDTVSEDDYKNLHELLEEQIQQLPVRQKEVFLLSKNEGLSSAEISKKLHLSQRTVENHLYRAKMFLKKKLVDDSLLTFLFFYLFIK